MILTHDPFTLIIDLMIRDYPERSIAITFESDMEEAGKIVFPDGDESDDNPTVIILYTDLPVSAVPEILCHELAHAISGFENGHNSEWESVFINLYKKFLEINGYNASDYEFNVMEDHTLSVIPVQNKEEDHVIHNRTVH